MMTSLYICAWLSIINGTLASICHDLLLSDHLLPSNCFCPSWTIHIFSSVPQDQPWNMCIKGWAQPSDSYHCWDKVWNVVEDGTMEIPNGDKVPLGDNRSATHEKTVLKTWFGVVKCILLSWHLNSYLKGYTHILERFSRSLLALIKGSIHHPTSTLWYSSWLLWLLSWNSTWSL